MKYRFRNPHPFDMSNYFSGLTCVVGGRDFELEEKEARREREREVPETGEKEQFKLDWSFLKSYPKPRPH